MSREPRETVRAIRKQRVADAEEMVRQAWRELSEAEQYLADCREDLALLDD